MTDFCEGCAEKENRLAAFRTHAEAVRTQRDKLAKLVRSVYCDNCEQMQPDLSLCQWCSDREDVLSEMGVQ